jgi:hypothetical protein
MIIIKNQDKSNKFGASQQVIAQVSTAKILGKNRK